MAAKSFGAERYVDAIRRSGLSIYDSIEIGHPELWIPTTELEQLLNAKMYGISLTGLPLRTRSKVVKEHICRSLGYAVPDEFKKVRPRFPGQIFDTYVQKSNNLQIWNEELTSNRRYVIIRVGSTNIIAKIRVVTGNTLVLLDTTGTLTQKYQAKLIPGKSKTELISDRDTKIVRDLTCKHVDLSNVIGPSADPVAEELLPIMEILERLRVLIGQSLSSVGHDQERNRGALLHRLVCQHLGYNSYRDDGQFPDIRHQLLEVKLQTSSTIDLGLVQPDSEEALDVPQLHGRRVRYRDVRYALFYAKTGGEAIELTHLFLTTGENFFTRFPQFKGKVLNKKLQIRLPSEFFD